MFSYIFLFSLEEYFFIYFSIFSRRIYFFIIFYFL
uniref:Uncharacterized protein n=1 Tax=viral metagenome TaxID=1070528 RepID=A0A6C0AEQ9_9ZZZZ